MSATIKRTLQVQGITINQLWTCCPSDAVFSEEQREMYLLISPVGSRPLGARGLPSSPLPLAGDNIMPTAR